MGFEIETKISTGIIGAVLIILSWKNGIMTMMIVNLCEQKKRRCSNQRHSSH